MKALDSIWEISDEFSLTWWARQGSNLRPIGYEPTALPLSYGPHVRSLAEGFQRVKARGIVADVQGTSPGRTSIQGGPKVDTRRGRGLNSACSYTAST